MSSEEMGDFIELSYSINLIEGPDDKPKVVKRNLKVKKLVNVNDIKNPTQVFNNSGKILKNKCKIFLKDEGELVIDKSYEEIRDLISKNQFEPKQQIGFKIKTKNKPKN